MCARDLHGLRWQLTNIESFCVERILYQAHSSWMVLVCQTSKRRDLSF